MPETRCIRHLRDYIALPSVNPMRRHDLPADIVGEARYAAHVRDQLRALDVDAELIGPADRPSVVAELRVPGARDTVLVASHLDTVPVDGMQIDPFDPSVRDGRVYGRGSCDTKGGMAALLAALEHVLPRGTLRCNLVVVGEADEELGSTGVRAVLEHLGVRRPDWVLATEPTELRVVTHHKGVAHGKLRARGVACHASMPENGRSAIVVLARAVMALDELAGELGERRDPRLGAATLSIGTMGGGSGTNVVADDAWLTLDRRLLPHEDAASARAEIEARLHAHGLDDVEVEWFRVEKDGLATPHDHPAVRRCQAALAAAGLLDEPTTASFGTDAGVLAQHGLPGVVLGPGSVAQAHSAIEWVEVRQVERMQELLVRLLEARG